MNMHSQVLRKLSIIENVYKAQITNEDLGLNPTDIENNPVTESRYFNRIHFIYKDDLFGDSFLWDFKADYKHQFAFANDNTSIKNELLEIRNKAKYVSDFFNANLSTGCEITKGFYAKGEPPNKREGYYSHDLETSNYHTAAVEILDDYSIDDFVVGFDSKLYYKVIEGLTNEPNTYLHNGDLNRFCMAILNFTDKFNLDKYKYAPAPTDLDGSNGKNISEQYINDNMINKLDEIESKMQGVIEEFTVIKCAAWVDLLFRASPSYFEEKYHKQHIKYCNLFAKARYRLIITAAMQKSQGGEHGERTKNAVSLKKYLNNTY